MRKLNNRIWWIAGMILLQVLVLLGLAGSNLAVEWYGKEIRLETAPVDPRDLFYGDYVILNYEISELPEEMWRGGEFPGYDDTVYVLLRPSSSDALVYEAVGLYSDRPQTAGDEVVLKARVKNNWDRIIRLSYGLERYYVPEGTGRALEEQQDKMQVVVKIAPWGQAKLSKLIVESS